MDLDLLLRFHSSWWQVHFPLRLTLKYLCMTVQLTVFFKNHLRIYVLKKILKQKAVNDI